MLKIALIQTTALNFVLVIIFFGVISKDTEG